VARPSQLKAYVDVNGDVAAADALKSIGYRASHTRPLMEQIVGVLQAQQARRIQSDPYTPLAEDTVERKVRELENPATFRDESRMIKGKPTRVPDNLFKAVTSPTHPGQLRVVTRASATFGLKSAGNGEFFYARFVQNVKGTKRRILAISPGNAQILVSGVASYIYDGWPKR
jgi:hypothetical protein